MVFFYKVTLDAPDLVNISALDAPDLVNISVIPGDSRSIAQDLWFPKFEDMIIDYIEKYLDSTKDSWIARLVEHKVPDLDVGGSNPTLF